MTEVENIHKESVDKVRKNGTVRVTSKCGVWRFCGAEVPADKVLEQCDGCGKYRIRDLEDMDVDYKKGQQ